MTNLSRLLCMTVLGVTVALGGACSTGGSGDQSSSCDSEAIDADKELMMVDEAIVADTRALNARPDGSAGPWSFRHLIEEMVPQGTSPSAFIRTWLLNWVTVKEINGFPVDVPNEDRIANLNLRLLCPWQKETPANACNADCTVCAGNELDLAKAPFRLMGIMNRVDLRDEIAAEKNGEGRLAYALYDGPADSPASQPLAMTVILEYVLPSTSTPQAWAERWHALGKFTALDEPYKVALQEITDSFVSRGAEPTSRNGSALGQLRTNESVFNWIWQLREFGFGDDGQLHMRGVRNTPGRELTNSVALKDFVKANAEAIRSNRFELPLSMRGGSADAVPQPYVWNLAGIDPETNRAFTNNTCNGCHTNGSALETAFHLTPYRTGTARLSAHLRDPNGGVDQTKLRTASLRRALCGN